MYGRKERRGPTTVGWRKGIQTGVRHTSMQGRLPNVMIPWYEELGNGFICPEDALEAGIILLIPNRLC